DQRRQQRVRRGGERRGAHRRGVGAGGGAGVGRRAGARADIDGRGVRGSRGGHAAGCWGGAAGFRRAAAVNEDAGTGMTVLVSGGTGFVGSAVVRELLRRGERVAVLGRSVSKIRERFGDDVEVREGDVREPSTLAPAMHGIDVVVNAVQFPNSPIENRRKGWT